MQGPGGTGVDGSLIQPSEPKSIFSFPDPNEKKVGAPTKVEGTEGAVSLDPVLAAQDPPADLANQIPGAAPVKEKKKKKKKDKNKDKDKVVDYD